jgi:hypothetical protein
VRGFVGELALRDPTVVVVGSGRKSLKHAERAVRAVRM